MSRQFGCLKFNAYHPFSYFPAYGGKKENPAVNYSIHLPGRICSPWSYFSYHVEFPGSIERATCHQQLHNPHFPKAETQLRAITSRIVFVFDVNSKFLPLHNITNNNHRLLHTSNHLQCGIFIGTTGRKRCWWDASVLSSPWSHLTWSPLLV